MFTVDIRNTLNSKDLFEMHKTGLVIALSEGAEVQDGT
jgi:hypothetical protein